MKFFIGVIMAMILFTGCTTTEPKVPTVKNNSLVTEVNQTEVPIESNLSSVEESSIDDENVILNVFNDELYFEKDKVGKDKRQVVIKYLDAHKWEKKALSRIYKEYKQLWSAKQSKDFFKILEEDEYLSLCSDRRYWDNLQFEESQPERDVLHSILLIRYLNNLSHGCPKWVESNAKIKNENAKEYISTKHILSLLPHNVIIPKLIASYEPKSKKFRKFMEKQKRLLELDTKDELVKASRLELEEHKRKLCKPKYKRRK